MSFDQIRKYHLKKIIRSIFVEVHARMKKSNFFYIIRLSERNINELRLQALVTIFANFS